jgi:hypothetical protein
MSIGSRSLARVIRATAWALLASGLFASGATAGLLEVVTTAGSASGVPDTEVRDALVGPISTTSTTQFGSPPGQSSSFGTSSAAADYGHLAVFGSGATYGSVSAPALTSDVTSTASWRDSFTVLPTDLSIIGSAAHGIALVGLTGTTSVSVGSPLGSLASAHVAYTVTVNLTGGSGAQSGVLLQTPGEAPQFSGDPLPLVLAIPFDVALGSPVDVFVQLTEVGDTNVSAGFGGNNTFDGDFSHSLRWGGISEMRDDQGNLINFSVTSDSGFDYSKPVPEPTSAGLLSLEALFVLGLVGIRLTLGVAAPR